MKKLTRQIRIGNILIGGGAPCSVQSMCSTDTRNIAATTQQITALSEAGCELVRCAVLDTDAAKALGTIKDAITIPLIADIHFDYKLALTALKKGVDGLRINPGNIGEKWKVQEVVQAARERSVPIRIGVNAGSLEKELLEKFGRPTAEAMVESALGHVRILEELGYDQIKISIKASDVMKTIEAYRLLSQRVDYPLHIGITEAGTTFSGTIKSSVGLGILLSEGIGDTLRVSLTGDPVDEMRVGYGILKALGLRQRGINLVHAPPADAVRLILSRLQRKLSGAFRGLRNRLPLQSWVAKHGCAEDVICLGVADDRQCRRHDEGSADAHERTRCDQLARRRDERRRQRTEAEQQEPDLQRAAPPNRSPRLPAVSRRPANTSVYASTIHCSWLLVASRSRTIVGMATLRIVLSSTITSRLKQRTARIHHRRSWARSCAWTLSELVITAPVGERTSRGNRSETVPDLNERPRPRRAPPRPWRPTCGEGAGGQASGSDPGRGARP